MSDEELKKIREAKINGMWENPEFRRKVIADHLIYYLGRVANGVKEGNVESFNLSWDGGDTLKGSYKLRQTLEMISINYTLDSTKEK